jgi:hypothetical protein
VWSVSQRIPIKAHGDSSQGRGIMSMVLPMDINDVLLSQFKYQLQHALYTSHGI